MNDVIERYIDEHYYRDKIGITYEDDNTVRLELKDRIIRLVCNGTIISSNIRKRRGIDFSDNPIEVKTPQQLTISDIPQMNDDTEEIEESIEDDFILPERVPRTDFNEGDIVKCIYNGETYTVTRQDDDIVYLFDKKSSTSMIIATADLIAV